jgi:hypothetical protein
VKLLALAFSVTALHATPAPDHARFLWAIQQVEGHRWSDDGGAWRIQRGTWSDYSKLPYRLASFPEHARPVAERHIAWLSRELAAAGYPVNAYTLGGAWRWGLSGFKERHARGWVEYGVRVHNLVHDKNSR